MAEIVAGGMPTALGVIAVINNHLASSMATGLGVEGCRRCSSAPSWISPARPSDDRRWHRAAGTVVSGATNSPTPAPTETATGPPTRHRAAEGRKRRF